jgi:hypothetical protein
MYFKRSNYDQTRIDFELSINKLTTQIFLKKIWARNRDVTTHATSSLLGIVIAQTVNKLYANGYLLFSIPS